MFANIVLLSCFKLAITVAALHRENPSLLYRTYIYCLQGLEWIYFPPPPIDQTKCSVDFEGCLPLRYQGFATAGGMIPNLMDQQPDSIWQFLCFLYFSNWLLCAHAQVDDLSPTL